MVELVRSGQTPEELARELIQQPRPTGNEPNKLNEKTASARIGGKNNEREELNRYVQIWSGFLYLSLVIDVFSRRVVGWAKEKHLRTELALKALEMPTS